jgi:hypothetical protein
VRSTPVSGATAVKENDMERMRTSYRGIAWIGFAVLMVWLGACTTTRTVETEYTPGGQMAYKRDKVNDDVKSELRRVFQTTSITGEGTFRSTNEGLARTAATEAAVSEMAGKVQTESKRSSVLYNNESFRSVTETSIRAIIKNYTIDFAGYDPGGEVYRVRVSVRTEDLIRAIETYIQ